MLSHSLSLSLFPLFSSWYMYVSVCAYVPVHLLVVCVYFVGKSLFGFLADDLRCIDLAESWWSMPAMFLGLDSFGFNDVFSGVAETMSGLRFRFRV